MSARTRTMLLAVAAVACIAVGVGLSANHQRSSADRAFRQSAAADHMLTAALDRETGLRGFLQTGSEDFLEPLRQGDALLVTAMAEIRGDTGRSRGRFGPAA